MNGVVKFFNTSKNFGFITGENGTDYFCHISGIEGGNPLSEGDKVSFDTEKGERGEKAVKIKKIE